MAWMPLLLENLSKNIPSFRYHGVDVVESIVNISKQKYAHLAPSWQMTALDISHDRLPTGYELIFSRDTLQHLPLNVVIDTLENFSRTNGSNYLLVGSYFKADDNKMVPVGGYFSINLLKPPFNLTTALRIYDERVADEQPKFLYLYDIPNYLRHVDFDAMRKRAILIPN